ncbi:hypothetical protein llap_6599 [Limosa lapponica baueri]|uniref:Uncharacterized protein n=1 Tax=Limosa lapponica baueri TaxID=1758121 RepID=A0A2I0UAR4_LIMLA|nr:hypothetical protein llap_6599 [Limosa lapponica baueri]
MVDASGEALLRPVQHQFSPSASKFASIANTGSSFMIQKPVVRTIVQSEKENKAPYAKRLVAKLSGHCWYRNSIVWRVRKEFKDEQEDLLQGAIFDNCSYHGFSALSIVIAWFPLCS